jgi:serine-type D-Ala-D-Ala carboxypeptidase/endopeptidase
MTRDQHIGQWGLALLVALALPAAAPGQQHFPSDADLEGMLHYLVEDGATPGVGLGVLEADGSTRVFASGRLAPDGRPVNAGSVFEIGSITKVFTATLLADMIERGEVGLDDPVSKYLPDGVLVPAWNGRPITLLDLATHRSGLPGLPDDFIPPANLADPYGSYGIDQLYGFLSRHQLRREPGSEAEYSNLGYGLLGHALARAAGAPFRELMRERILEPLGMTDTGWTEEGVLAHRLAEGHKHGRVVRRWTTTEAFDGAGGLRSTVPDMLKFVEANVGPAGSPLERALRATHRDRGPHRDEVRIGLGWMLEDGDGRTIVRHGGSSAGFSAMVGFDLDRGVGFVRLTNTGRFPDNVGLHLLRTGPPPAVQAVTVPPELLAQYAGTYELAPGTHFYIRLEDDGTLTSQGGPNTVRFPMTATSDSTFVVKRVPARLAFARNAAGAVDAMVLGARRLPRVADDTPPAGLPGIEILDLPLTDSEMARYQGTYVLQLGGGQVEARVRESNGSLEASLEGGVPTRLLHQGDHTFVLEADPDGRVLFMVDGDRATAIRIGLAGAMIPGLRRP